MSSNVKNQVAFLRTTREFPTDSDKLLQELNKAYVETANVVNTRIAGIFPTTFSAQNGENWFVKQNLRQQGFRKVFVFTSTSPINHGLKFNELDQFVRCWGTYTDGTNWYGLIFGSNVAIAGQISFYITPNTTPALNDGQIIFLTGAGAPTLTRGSIVLEWIGNP